MSNNFDVDDERKQLENLPDDELEQLAVRYDLLPEGVSLEDKSEAFIDGLIGEIIEARAYHDSQNAEWDEQQNIFDQQRRDEDY
ncbi:TPA: hypothetical protein ACTYIV_000966 [Citrobacter koseri]|uniref:hypothetical protein n=1 Tax=Citrobacter TaxID=544 RepID=UPI000D8AE656|nr:MULTISPECIES: hypothetical protein [Citrobacter]SQB62352.1 Uncharacterised protein [Citrobacter koseri]HBC9089321.1 hypothetical protein [Citrobacter koseri]HBK4928797.1 hypothetical protein [Citrobacter freundii]HCU0190974.1 hypothetical protein [Citrobacter koseri]